MQIHQQQDDLCPLADGVSLLPSQVDDLYIEVALRSFPFDAAKCFDTVLDRVLPRRTITRPIEAEHGRPSLRVCGQGNEGASPHGGHDDGLPSGSSLYAHLNRTWCIQTFEPRTWRFSIRSAGPRL